MFANAPFAARTWSGRIRAACVALATAWAARAEVHGIHFVRARAANLGSPRTRSPPSPRRRRFRLGRHPGRAQPLRRPALRPLPRTTRRREQPAVTIRHRAPPMRRTACRIGRAPDTSRGLTSATAGSTVTRARAYTPRVERAAGRWRDLDRHQRRARSPRSASGRITQHPRPRPRRAAITAMWWDWRRPARRRLVRQSRGIVPRRRGCTRAAHRPLRDCRRCASIAPGACGPAATAGCTCCATATACTGMAASRCAGAVAGAGDRRGAGRKPVAVDRRCRAAALRSADRRRARVAPGRTRSRRLAGGRGQRADDRSLRVAVGRHAILRLAIAASRGAPFPGSTCVRRTWPCTARSRTAVRAIAQGPAGFSGSAPTTAACCASTPTATAQDMTGLLASAGFDAASRASPASPAPPTARLARHLAGLFELDPRQLSLQAVDVPGFARLALRSLAPARDGGCDSAANATADPLRHARRRAPAIPPCTTGTPRTRRNWPCMPYSKPATACFGSGSNHGLEMLDPRSGRHRAFHDQPGQADGLGSDLVRALAKDGRAGCGSAPMPPSSWSRTAPMAACASASKPLVSATGNTPSAVYKLPPTQ